MTKQNFTEEQITEEICDYLTLLLPNAQINRIAPSGFFKNGRMIKHKSQHIKKGVCDIQVFYKNNFYGLEVKSEKEYRYVKKHYEKLWKSPTHLLNKKQIHLQEQIKYLENIKNNGFITGFVCSIETVNELLGKK